MLINFANDGWFSQKLATNTGFNAKFTYILYKYSLFYLTKNNIKD